MNTDQDAFEILSRALFQDADQDRSDFLNSNGSFAYYTTADTALKIISSKTIWMRSALVMNDYSEVHYGRLEMKRAFETRQGSLFWQALSEINPTLSSTIEQEFYRKEFGLANNIFLTCLTMNHQENEAAQQYGKLSMWRAYGGTDGVALILNKRPFTGNSSALGIYSQPIMYEDHSKIAARLGKIAKRLADIKNNLHKYQEASEHAFEHLKKTINAALDFQIACLKHPAFREEEEWRIVRHLDMGTSTLEEDIQSVGGIPQKILKIPLVENPELGLIGYNLNDLLIEVLIGPTQYPQTLKTAICETMKKNGISNPETRVRPTYIPLRPSRGQ